VPSVSRPIHGGQPGRGVDRSSRRAVWADEWIDARLPFPALPAEAANSGERVDDTSPLARLPQ
jgi:hypothetical protein